MMGRGFWELGTEGGEGRDEDDFRACFIVLDYIVCFMLLMMRCVYKYKGTSESFLSSKAIKLL